ncbi:glutaredoxin family protein [Halobacillus sp. A1]|uniref:glutaredoxin family protein n=1 Tax=Halobacillus sp. A1 TaxID=2880262 RepID=UPI0020A63894|nr:glutaredoxin family protein [Halobacillus sp. A1]MCP3029749.1 glutaredoxin family protein [Halobacillus sp. A1]
MTQHSVIVYTSDQCSQCEKVLAKLSEWNIEYKEKNISRDNSYFKELQSQKIYGTPATFINDEKVLGFQERKLKRTLGIQDAGRFQDTDTIHFS